MGWASGIYTRIFGSTGWQNDKAALIKILASRHDTHDQDIGDGLNTLRTELRGESLTNATKVLTSVAGTNTITASMTSPTPAGSLTSYSAGLCVVLTPANTNSGATTLNVNSLGALDVMNPDGTACVGGELIAGVTTELVLDAGADDWIITSPPFSKAIAPTWTGKHLFTGGSGSTSNPNIGVNGTTPIFVLNETDGPADEKLWSFFASGGTLQFYASNDADSGGANWLTVDRTGATVDTVNFPRDGAQDVFVVGTDSAVAYNSNRAKIRTTANATALAVVSAGASAATLAVHNEATAGDNQFINFFTEAGAGATARGSISYNRAGGLVAYNTTSSERLKENIRDSASAMSKLAQIKVRAFDWKGNDGARLDWWAVAEELAAVCPWAADESGVNPGALVFLTIKAVQELHAEQRSLDQRIRALEQASIAATKR